jgi:hypothetical protein
MSSKKTAPAGKATPAAAPAEAASAEEPAKASAAAPDGPDATEAADGTEERPLNRAERRAKGKSATAAQPTFRGKVVGGHGPAHTQRMWSNRRSGG